MVAAETKKKKSGYALTLGEFVVAFLLFFQPAVRLAHFAYIGVRYRSNAAHFCCYCGLLDDFTDLPAPQHLPQRCGSLYLGRLFLTLPADLARPTWFYASSPSASRRIPMPVTWLRFDITHPTFPDLVDRR